MSFRAQAAAAEMNSLNRHPYCGSLSKATCAVLAIYRSSDKPIKEAQQEFQEAFTPRDVSKNALGAHRKHKGPSEKTTAASLENEKGSKSVTGEKRASEAVGSLAATVSGTAKRGRSVRPLRGIGQLQE